MDRLFDVASLIVVAAIIATIVGSKNTQAQIKALTGGFADVLRAATAARK
jgi:uncharacterized protein YejL (UPF0352 family)